MSCSKRPWLLSSLGVSIRVPFGFAESSFRLNALTFLVGWAHLPVRVSSDRTGKYAHPTVESQANTNRERGTDDFGDWNNARSAKTQSLTYVSGCDVGKRATSKAVVQGCRVVAKCIVAKKNNGLGKARPLVRSTYFHGCVRVRVPQMLT
jgi:hypothetical protein